MPDTLDYEFFATLTGRTFRIQFASRLVDLQLTEVTKLPPVRTMSKTGEAVAVETIPRKQPFSMFFQGPADVRIAQGTYPMTVESVDGPLDIFIVPVARAKEGFTYQAIFS